MINSSKSHLILQPRSFIRLFHLFVIYLFLFTKFLFVLIYFDLLYFINLPLFIYTLLILLHNLFSFTLIHLTYFTLFLFILLISFIREFYCESACSNYKIYWFLSDYLL